MQELFQNFEKLTVKSATEAAEREVSHRPDWFSESEDILLNLIDKMNDALKLYSGPMRKNSNRVISKGTLN
jgi:hypothetical protein